MPAVAAHAMLAAVEAFPPGPAHTWPLAWKLLALGLWLLALPALAIALFEIVRSWYALTGRAMPPARGAGLLDRGLEGPAGRRNALRTAALCVGIALYMALFLHVPRIGWPMLALMGGSQLVLYAFAHLAALRNRQRLADVLQGSLVIPPLLVTLWCRGPLPPQLVQFAWFVGIAAGIVLPLGLGMAWLRWIAPPRGSGAAGARIMAATAILLLAGWTAAWWFPRL